MMKRIGFFSSKMLSIRTFNNSGITENSKTVDLRGSYLQICIAGKENGEKIGWNIVDCPIYGSHRVCLDSL